MRLTFRKDYTALSDEALVGLIVEGGHNDEAGAYLVYERYRPLLVKCYLRVFDGDMQWLDDCLGDLYLFLRGREGGWRKLASFEWRCRFASWLIRLATNRFLEMKPYLIGKINFRLSISEDDEREDASDGLDEYERREREVLLLEAVGLLEDTDQRFVVLKRLQGYSSRETAELLSQMWERHGIVKRDLQGRPVRPTAGYVDVRMQRAKAALRLIIADMDV